MLGIDWKNGQAGGTPLSAENLKLVQSMIETEIANQVQDLNIKINKMKETVLYNNSAGTNQTITLNDSIVNYDYAEIYYKDEHALHNSVKIYKPNQKRIDLHSFHAYSQSNTVISDTSIVYFDEDKLIANKDQEGTSDADTYGSWNSWNNSIAATNHIYITRVVGYKIIENS